MPTPARPLALLIGVTIVAGAMAPDSACAAFITAHGCTVQADNSMRFDCQVTLTGSDDVVIGVRPTTGGAWRWSQPRTGSAVTLTLYNFDPDLDYEYKVYTSNDTSAVTALTGGPELPTLVADLNWQLTVGSGALTKYVLLDSGDCQRDQNYLLVLNVLSGKVAWYQDLDAATGAAGATLRGWSYTGDDTILASMADGTVWEWGWDGSPIGSPPSFAGACEGDAGDFGPCPHHDVWRTPAGGKYYTLTGATDFRFDPATNDYYSTCAGVDSYVNDGLVQYDGAWTETASWTMMDDFGFDPDADAGPHTHCDSGYWAAFLDGNHLAQDLTHTNSVYAYGIGASERIALSLRRWSEVLLIDPNTGGLVWRLDGTANTSLRGDFSIVNDASVAGPTDFGGQHNVEAHQGQVQMFDNRYRTNDPDVDARGLWIEPDLMTGVATIQRSWVMREPTGVGTWQGLDCSDGLGSAQIVPGSGGEHMLLNCGHNARIQEIDEYDGNYTRDAVVDLWLDNPVAGPADWCVSSADPFGPSFWYRAWPLGQLGEF